MGTVDAIGLCLGGLLTVSVLIIIGGFLAWYMISIHQGEKGE